MVPDPAKLESVPPVTVTMEAVKLTGVSPSVKVRTVVSPALRADLSAVIAIVGGMMSIVMGVFRPPDVFGLPAASVNRPASTETVPVPLKPMAGVNVAV